MKTAKVHVGGGMLFGGVGGEVLGMARSLLQGSHAFRRAFTRAADFFEVALKVDVRRYIDDPSEFSRFSGSLEHSSAATLAYQCACVDHLQSHDVSMRVALAHSFGGYAAAYACGAVDLEAACTLVASRCEIVRQHCALGVMIAAFADVHAINQSEDLLERAEVASINGPTVVVLGVVASDEPFIVERLARLRIRYRVLPVQYAFHTAHNMLPATALMTFEGARRMALAKTQTGPSMLRVHIEPGPRRARHGPAISEPSGWRCNRVPHGSRPESLTWAQ